MQNYVRLLTAGILCFCAIPLYGVLQLSEVRIDHFGVDTDEFIEIKGDPGESLDGVWFIYIGDHSGQGSFKGSGVIEIAINLTGFSIPDDGHFLMVGPNLNVDAFGLEAEDIDFFVEGLGTGPGLLENTDNVTILLVRDFTGNGGNQILGIDDQLGDAAVDIDDNDDGIPNETLPWSEIIDAVGYIDSDTGGDFFYGAALGFEDVGPLPNNDVPGHIWRGGDDGKWHISNRALFLTDENDNIIGLDPEAPDTPGSPNPDSPIAIFPPSIDTISAIFVQPGDVVEIEGSNLSTVSSSRIGAMEADFSLAEESLLLTIPSGAVSGYITVTNADGESTSANIVVIIDDSEFVFVEDFQNGLGEFATVSLSSDSNWEQSNFRDSGSAGINGFFDDNPSDDWLISSSIDLTSVTNPYLILGHERVFSGAPLEVKISTDVDARANPAGASWADLDVTLAGDNAREIIHSGKVDLSAYTDQSVTIAIRYTALGGGNGGAQDRIHYLAVGGESLGWIKTDEFGWLFYLSSEWGVSADLGTIYTGEFPWIYQTNFGYLYHVVFIDGFGFWLFSPELEWIFLGQGDNGWFSASGLDWDFDNFINPQG